jgi:hypothetical protein
VILDATTLLSFFDRESVDHWAVTGEIELAAEIEQLVVSPFVIAELELIVRERYGAEAWLSTLDALAQGAWAIAPVSPQHLAALRPRVASGASLATASVDVLAAGEAS